MTRFDLTGPHALTMGTPQTIVFAVKDANGSNHAMTGHTCKLVARPSHGHETAWVDLSEASGIVLSAGSISASIPSVGTQSAPNGLRGVFDCVLLDAAGKRVLHLGGDIEFKPTCTFTP